MLMNHYVIERLLWYAYLFEKSFLVLYEIVKNRVHLRPFLKAALGKPCGMHHPIWMQLSKFNLLESLWVKSGKFLNGNVLITHRFASVSVELGLWKRLSPLDKCVNKFMEHFLIRAIISKYSRKFNSNLASGCFEIASVLA